MALCQETRTTRGVDSGATSERAVASAELLNQKFGAVVCITGKTDYIVSSSGITRIKNGDAMMPMVTGLGCTASALCGAFAAVNPDCHLAAAHAMAVMGIAGQIAAEAAHGPASLQLNFIDTLYLLSETQIQDYLQR
jgi:hydroxyethylthiazole kinase